MTYLDSGFNQFLERPVPKPQVQSEFDAESFIQGLSGSSIIGGAISSLSGNLQLDLEKGELLSSDGRVVRKNLPSPQIIVDIKGGGDFAGIQEAINYAHQLEGGVVLLKPGIHKPSAQLKLYDNIYLIGQDTENTIIDFTEAGLGDGDAGILGKGVKVTDEGTITVTTGNTTVFGVGTDFVDKGVKAGDTIFISQHPYTISSVVSNTRLELTDTHEGVTAAGENYAIIIPISNISVATLAVRNTVGTNTDGIRIDYGIKPFISKVKVTNAEATGIKLRSCFNFVVQHSESKDNTNGIIITNVAGEDNVTNGTIINSYGYNNLDLGLQITSNCLVRVSGGNYSKNRNTGIDLNSDDCNVIGCQLERNLADGITIDGSFNTILGNSIIDNDSDGVVIENTADFPQRNRIIGNEIRLNNAYGINIAGANATDNVTSGNTFAGNTSGDVDDNGTTTQRATRYVPTLTAVTLLNNDPAAATYNVDASASVSATAYAVFIKADITPTAADQVVQVQDTGNTVTYVYLRSAAAVKVYADGPVPLDSSKTFDAVCSHAAITTLTITLLGYWEYID